VEQYTEIEQEYASMATSRSAPIGYIRFTLSYRDVEDLLAERALDVSYETVRWWVLKFGPLLARELRHRGPRPTSRQHDRPGHRGLDRCAVRHRIG
jgi:hypothetical protein